VYGGSIGNDNGTNPLAFTPTGLAVGLALSLRYTVTKTAIRPNDLGPPLTPP
jgi:hypothetical protein